MKHKISYILFNGYVREPLPMVLIASVVGIAFLAFAIWSTIDLCTPLNYNTTIELLTVVEYEQDGPIYSLLASDGFYYDLPINAIDDSSMIDYLVENKVSVFVEYISATDSNIRSRDIASISTHDQITIVASDIIFEVRASDAKISSIIMWGICLLYWLFIALSYYVICNAPKYPKIAALLVRESFRNF